LLETGPRGVDFPAGLGEFLLELGHWPGIDRGPRNQEQIAATGNIRLPVPKNFTQPTPGPIAIRGAAHRGSGGNHANPWNIAAGRVRRRRIALLPPDRKSPAFEPPPLLANRADIVRATQMLLMAKAHTKKG
jgi:hypothetical protein